MFQEGFNIRQLGFDVVPIEAAYPETVFILGVADDALGFTGINPFQIVMVGVKVDVFRKTGFFEVGGILRGL